MLAWEWLRRDPAYREAAGRVGTVNQRSVPNHPLKRSEGFGLHAFESPALPAPLARPVWTAGHYAHVLSVEAERTCSCKDGFDLERLRSVATLVTGSDGREHLLLSDGFRSLRLDVEKGSVSSGLVRLRYRLEGVAGAEGPLLTLRRLLVLLQTGCFSRALHRPERRARRWVLMLRAHDAIGAGADQRQIAAALFSPEAAGSQWRANAPSLRSQAQRLVRGSRHMAAGGYRMLLH